MATGVERSSGSRPSSVPVDQNLPQGTASKEIKPLLDTMESTSPQESGNSLWESLKKAGLWIYNKAVQLGDSDSEEETNVDPRVLMHQKLENFQGLNNGVDVPVLPKVVGGSEDSELVEDLSVELDLRLETSQGFNPGSGVVVQPPRLDDLIDLSGTSARLDDSESDSERPDIKPCASYGGLEDVTTGPLLPVNSHHFSDVE